jgi:hypothetical protein
VSPLRGWRILFASLLIVESAAGAAFTSTQTGNWSATSTWGGSGPPGNGDTATIAAGNVVTVDVDTTVGTSPVNGTNVVTLAGSSSQVVISSGHLFRLRGDFQIHSSLASATPSLVMNAGATLEFDSSLAASPATTKYQVKPDNAFAFNFFEADGTALSHCTVRSNGGGGNGYFGVNGFTQTNNFLATYTDFLRIGDASNPGFSLGFSGNGTVNWDVQHCTFTSCGLIKTDNASAVGATVVRHKFNTHVSTLGGNVTYMTFQNALTTGVRDVSSNVFDGVWGTDGSQVANMQDVTMNDNFFYQTPLFGGVSTWASFARNIQRNACTGGIKAQGDMTDDYIVTDCVTEPHIHNPDLGQGLTSFSALRDIFDSTYLASDPIATNDGIVENLATDILVTLTAKNNIVLPTGDSIHGSQALIDMFGPNHTQYDLEHNTINCPKGAGCIMMEYEDVDLPNGVPNRGTLSNSIFWAQTNLATNFAANLDIENPINPFFAVANIQKNSRFNLASTNPAAPHNPPNQGNSYIGAWPSTPGASDVNGNPQFVNTTRNLATFDTAFLGNGATSQWVTSHVYNPGDMVSDPQAAYYAGALINYRCTTSHTSGAGNEPGIGSGWHNDWEFASWNDIRNAVAAGTTTNGDSYIVALEKWIRAGFAPRNQALKGAATDGGDIGAVPVVAGSPWLVSGSQINGAKIR